MAQEPQELCDPSSGGECFLGIEIGGTKLQVVAGDAALRIHRRWRGRVDREQGAEGIRRQLEQAIDELLSHGPAQAVGIGFGGPINWRTGRIECSHQIDGWESFSLRDWVQDVTDLPAAVDNDANVAALGEAHAGAGVSSNPVFYVTLGSGVGGGLVVDGHIYHGLSPGEAEFGHMRLDRTGATVESRCCGWAIDRRIRALEGAGGVLARLIGPRPGGEARHLAEALRQNDPAAQQILGELAEDLAFAFSHVVHLLHPQVLILGGGLSLIGDPLRSAVADRLPQFVMRAFHPVPAVRLAELGESAVPVGALQLAMMAVPKPVLAAAAG